MGNGGSASICNHVTVDLSKNAGIRSINFNEANLITCLSNDYGHDNWMKEALKIHCLKMTLWCLYPFLESQKILLMHLNGVEEIKLKWPPFLDLKITILFKKIIKME